VKKFKPIKQDTTEIMRFRGSGAKITLAGALYSRAVLPKLGMEQIVVPITEECFLALFLPGRENAQIVNTRYDYSSKIIEICILAPGRRGKADGRAR